MKFDSILSEINGFGKFQIKLVLIQMLSRIMLPCHFLLNNFMAAVPSHHCDITALDDGAVFGNLSLEQKLAVGLPAEQDGTASSCQMFSKPLYQHLSGSNSSENTFTIQCQNGWVYDNSTFKSTLATEVSVLSKYDGIVSSYICYRMLYSSETLMTPVFCKRINYISNVCLPHLKKNKNVVLTKSSASMTDTCKITYCNAVNGFFAVGSRLQQKRDEQGNCHHFLCWCYVWSPFIWVSQ